MKYTIGIDEAGRGPLAGPVSVGIVRIPELFDKKFFKNIRDSKKLSEKSRDEWFAKARKHNLLFAVSLVSERIIDRRGISYAIRLAIKRCLKKVGAKPDDQILLDGSLKAPKEFKNQETIIGGDDKIAVIGMASICAKVTRDKRMLRLAKKFPEYGFEVHKGYGTHTHYQAIKKHGVSPVHRQSFLKNI
jgi:ribonuclease HII